MSRNEDVRLVVRPDGDGDTWFIVETERADGSIGFERFRDHDAAKAAFERAKAEAGHKHWELA
jgi:hypothetical protein